MDPIETTYRLADSPIKDRLLKKLVEFTSKQRDEDGKLPRAVENAAYYAIKKRMPETPYNGDLSAYLIALASDVSDGKYEFDETNYYSELANTTFQSVRMLVMEELILLNNGELEPEEDEQALALYIKENKGKVTQTAKEVLENTDTSGSSESSDKEPKQEFVPAKTNLRPRGKQSLFDKLRSWARHQK